MPKEFQHCQIMGRFYAINMQAPVVHEEPMPSTPARSYPDLPVIETISGRLELTRDKQHQKLMQGFNDSLFAHDCTVEVMGCSQEVTSHSLYCCLICDLADTNPAYVY